LFGPINLATGWNMKMPASMPRPRLKGFRHSREIIAYAVWGYCGSGWPRVGALGVLWVWGSLGSLPRHVGHRGVRRAPDLQSFWGIMTPHVGFRVELTHFFISG
jgi:hypothetical protein